MIKRQKILRLIAKEASNEIKLVCCLGRTSRDVYSFLGEDERKNCFFNMGAMGSTLPLSIGLSITIQKNVYAIEGDGSVIMNLGGLVTYKRYNPSNLVLFIIDNKQYETTGGQPTQPIGFDFEKLTQSLGLKTIKVKSEKTLQKVLVGIRNNISSYDVIVIDALPDKISQRISEMPYKLSNIFKQNLSVC